MTNRPLCSIAQEILNDWQPISRDAAPYVRAMQCVRVMDDSYICDTGRDLVVHFLSNARGWRGETARLVKQELNRMLKEHSQGRERS